MNEKMNNTTAILPDLTGNGSYKPILTVKMKIDKYIKWDEIWSEEICLQTSIDCLDESDVESIAAIQQFRQDSDVSLLMSECQTNGDNLIFCFSESGGQSEGDSQGWSRKYTFTVDSDFMVVSAEYSQG